jgi:hypothetical protein
MSKAIMVEFLWGEFSILDSAAAAFYAAPSSLHCCFAAITYPFDR